MFGCRKDFGLAMRSWGGWGMGGVYADLWVFVGLHGGLGPFVSGFLWQTGSWFSRNEFGYGCWDLLVVFSFDHFNDLLHKVDVRIHAPDHVLYDLCELLESCPEADLSSVPDTLLYIVD